MLSFISKIGSFLLDNILLPLANWMKLWDFKSWIIFIFAILLGVSLFFGHKYYKASLNTLILYYTDSLDRYKNKVKEEYVSRILYVQTVELLLKLNSILYKEIKNLRDNPIIITLSEIRFHTDTIITKPDTILMSKDSTRVNLLWSYVEPTNKYFSLDGVTNVRRDFLDFSTKVNNFLMDANITFDVVDDDLNIRVIAKSSNPYLNINNMTGVVVDPSKSKVLKKYFPRKKINVGPYIGVGFDKNMKVSPHLGFGVQYSLFGF